ncbi:hypothetical protein EUGRSUZ_G00783 [Eucalyptus grandis]|uniref:Uncharacterized protein n=2 Tax=Eucalyptus grandis TaxID=71139 RepID=A0ACC3K270_EUCGR|nr:hypothetical protein EUGRSUZ_G00783 [Eucalyptus grandis]
MSKLGSLSDFFSPPLSPLSCISFLLLPYTPHHAWSCPNLTQNPLPTALDLATTDSSMAVTAKSRSGRPWEATVGSYCELKNE